MNALQLVTSEPFCDVRCDFYQDHQQDIVMTREQIGAALEYDNPMIAIAKIHDRHKERLDKFSTLTKLGNVEGGRTVERQIVVYNTRGIYEICRWSRQPKADAFMDWVWNIIEGLRTGTLLPQLTQPAKPSDALTTRLDRLISLLERQYEQPAVITGATKKDEPVYLPELTPEQESSLYRHQLKEKQLLTKFEAAAYLGVCKGTLTRIMNKGDFYPLVRIGHNRGVLRFNREKLDQWINEQDGQHK